MQSCVMGRINDSYRGGRRNGGCHVTHRAKGPSPSEVRGRKHTRVCGSGVVQDPAASDLWVGRAGYSSSVFLSISRPRSRGTWWP